MAQQTIPLALAPCVPALLLCISLLCRPAQRRKESVGEPWLCLLDRLAGCARQMTVECLCSGRLRLRHHFCSSCHPRSRLTISTKGLRTLSAHASAVRDKARAIQVEFDV